MGFLQSYINENSRLFMQTEKLFNHDQYQKEFEANVLNVEGSQVVLDKTCFFPQGGGQVGDVGTIGGINVFDTKKSEDGKIIFHIMEKENAFKEGDSVKGEIDWERRYKIMKLHSADHFVYFFMQQVFPGCKYASSGIVDDRKSRIDYVFERNNFDKEKLKEVEKKTNDFLKEGHEINVWSEETNPDYRYWSCGMNGAEFKMPCGGTHPKNTSEIGAVKIGRGKNPGGGKVRIEITLSA